VQVWVKVYGHSGGMLALLTAPYLIRIDTDNLVLGHFNDFRKHPTFIYDHDDDDDGDDVMTAVAPSSEYNHIVMRDIFI